MELFSVACITCRAKIKVQSVSAIGQVLACPRCGGMVEISAPPGWKPPATAKPSGPAKPVAGKPLPGATAPARPQPTSSGGAAAPVPATGPTGDAISPGEYVGIAEPVLDDDPLIEAQRLAAERERKQRKLLLIGGAGIGVLLVVGGIWAMLRKPEEIVENPAAGPEAKPSATTKLGPKPSATAAPKPSPTAAPTPSGAVPVAAPTATPTVLAAPTASATTTVIARVDPPMAVPSATTPPAPQPIPSATPTATAAPVKPPVPLAPAPGLAPPSPEALARLAVKAPALELAGIPRRSALEIVGGLAGVGVQYDWDSLSPTELKLSELVTLKPGDSTYDALIATLLEPTGAQVQIVGDVILVRGPSSVGPTVSVDYGIDDLASTEVSQAELYAGLVQLFVEPASWAKQGGSGVLAVAAGKLTATQPPAVQLEVLAWLERLRTARGKPTKGPTPNLASRGAQAKKSLDKLVTMNFRPGVPLAEVLEFLEKQADVVLTIDYAALGNQGFEPDARIGIAADKNSLSQVLSALCEPREWAWRIVDERTFEITTRDALRRRGYTELYDIKPLVDAGIAPVELIRELKTQFADAGWSDAGGDGVMRFDAASNRLLVRQHQDAQLRIDRFLTDLIAAARAPTPSSGAPTTPAPPGAAPVGTAKSATSVP